MKKIDFQYLFCQKSSFEINVFRLGRLLRAEREARSESTSIIWEKSQYERPAGRGHALWTLISLERDDQFTNGHLNTMSPSNQSCI